ncbi:hypothetical protein DPM19_27660 [Actinomadura craniellae]|uniref:Uncharacterized protein n=1 Tax=Actinomadura craniellae TaxID=2231787 RepID=A0A365GZ68_9ACTN|nr:hypothetical protein [Actinomadura craniellae]RAY12111.1 hypothetical protein DPM19_27660 [Actinomadura craniellae]
MRWPWKAARLPVRDELDLARGERVLAHAPTRGGSHVVATTTALHLPTAEGGFTRLPWEGIDHAQWENGRLHVHEPDGEHHVGLTDPGSVPETVRERITATVVTDHEAKLPGGGRVRIAGRRAIGGDRVQWNMIFEPGMDPSDPGLRAQAEQVLADLRRRTGL